MNKFSLKTALSMIGIDNENRYLFLAFFTVLLSRLPFLNAGYGLDADSWRVIHSARLINLTGQYTASRLPGYPLQEYVLSLFWRGGPFACNLITAVLSSFSFLFFALSLKKLQSRDYIVGALALAFTPIVYINSTTTIDYVWALTFAMGSMYFILDRKPIISGICLGLAIGCRITSGSILIPLLLLLIHQDRSLVIKRIFYFSIPALVVGAIIFSPVICKYGFTFFRFYDGWPSTIEVIRRISVEVWGGLGTILILLSLFFLIIFHGQQSSIIARGRLLTSAIVIGILIFLIAFLRLPQESGYLIPTIPFVILFLALFLKRSYFIIVCIGLTMSSFIPIPRHNELNASIFDNHFNRLNKEKFINEVLDSGKNGNTKRVIVCGANLTQIEVNIQFNNKNSQRVKYVYLLNNEELKKYLLEGYLIYYLPDQDKINLKIHGVDLKKYGGLPLLEKK